MEKHEKEKVKEIEAVVKAAMEEGATGSAVEIEWVAQSKLYEVILPASSCGNSGSSKTKQVNKKEKGRKYNR